MKQLKEIDRKLAGVLLEAVERKEFRVTYKEVAERLSPRLGRTVNPHYELAGRCQSFAMSLAFH